MQIKLTLLGINNFFTEIPLIPVMSKLLHNPCLHFGAFAHYT